VWRLEQVPSVINGCCGACIPAEECGAAGG